MNTLLITNSIEKSRNYICQQLQAAWATELIKDNRKKTKDFLKEPDYFKIIDSKEKLESLDKKFIPEIIFIVPELMWANDDVNEGYDVVRDIITHRFKDKFIQIVFLSVLDRRTIISIVEERNKGFLEAFPHVCLLDDEPVIKFNYYSEIHFQLIKYLAISDHGRLQKAGHELNSVKTNIQKQNTDIDKGKAGLLKILDELSLFKAWTGANLTETRTIVDEAESTTTLSSASRIVEGIIDEINIKIPKAKGDNAVTIKRQSYRVLTIEDEKDYQHFFHDTFSQFYDFVYPDKSNKVTLKNNTTIDFSISNALDILKIHGKDFDIILLDLLYKDENENWLYFNGLDLFQLIHKVNPHAVIRIITSLPRSIVSRVVDVILNEQEKPNTDQVLTKKYGLEALKDFIFESIEVFNHECEQKAKAKNIWAPFPKKGPFEWSGIQSLMHEIMFEKPEEFECIKNKAIALFNKYLENNLSKQTEGWNSGELISPKQKNKGNNAIYIKGKLVNTLVHRLFILNEAVENEKFIVNYHEYESKISTISGTSSVGKEYFHTKLGFSKEKENINHTKSNSFIIQLKNLFPHESEFISGKLISKSKTNEKKMLSDFNPALNDWFRMILGQEKQDATLYEIWGDLSLDFNPYENQKNNLDAGESINTELIPDDLTLKNLRDFLISLNKKFSKPFVCDIVDFLTNYPINENIIGDYVIETLINNLFEKE